MDNSTIEQINKIFKTKKLTWCGNFLRYDDNADQDCYDFTFQINKIKPMISIGNWTDFALVDVTLYVDPNTVLGKLVSGEYKDIFGDSEQLLRFYPIKNGTADKITKALKLVSELDVIVTSIKPVLVGDDKIVEPICLISLNLLPMVFSICQLFNKPVDVSLIFKELTLLLLARANALGAVTSEISAK